jgi:hypothetical protein
LGILALKKKKKNAMVLCLHFFLFCILAMEKRNNFMSTNFYNWHSGDGKEEFFLFAFCPLLTIESFLFIHEKVYVVPFWCGCVAICLIIHDIIYVASILASFDSVFPFK